MEEGVRLVVEGLPSPFQVPKVKEFFSAVIDLYELEGKIINVGASRDKVFLFLTATSKNTAEKLMCKNLLYCGEEGNAYPIKVRPFYCNTKRNDKEEKQRKKTVTENSFTSRAQFTDKESDIQKPLKYRAPDHVYFTPEYSLANNPVTKKKKRKRNDDENGIWFGGLGSVKNHSRFKKKKKAAAKKRAKSSILGKLAGKSESFQFGLESQQIPNNLSEGEKNAEGVEDNGSLAENHLTKIQNQQVQKEDEKPVTKRSTGWQVIVEHGCIGPLCFEVQPETTVADIKQEIEQRRGLPSTKQILFLRSVKVKDEDCLKYLAGVDEKDICLTLSSGALKGGSSPRCSCMFFVVCERVRGEK